MLLLFKSHPILTPLFSISFICLLIVLVLGGLNYQGYCWAENRFLSDEERNLIALEYVESLPRSVGPLPNCCTEEYDYKTMGVDGVPSRRFWSRVFGVSSDYIFVKYLSKNLEIFYERVSLQNCGIVN